MATSGSENVAPTIAPYPFNLASADIILRTPDLTEFHVQSFLLTIASPIFSDMLSLPQPQVGNQSCTTTRPIVDVTEDSRTLERLLRLCYPTTKPTFDVLEDIVLVFKAAIKYDMEWVIPPLMKDLKVVVPQNPLRAWAVACRSASELEDVAREAASTVLATLLSLQQERKNRTISRVSTPILALLNEMLREQGDEVLDGVCAGDLFRLRQFIVSESSKPSFTVLTPPPPAAQEDHAVEVLSPTAAILQIGLPDVLLQCTNGTQHPAHSFVLAFHSPVLGKEIEAVMVPTPASSDSIDLLREKRGPLPVIPLAETSPETLAVLLGLCYGTTSPPSQLPLLASALVASRRYAMAQAEKLVAECWDNLTKLSPLEAYFIAIQHGLETCARAAAMVVLEHPITTSYVEVMESSSALAYRRILEYYSSCTDAVGSHLKTVMSQWNTAATSLDYYARQRNPRESYYYVARHQGSVETYLSGLVRSVQDHGPQSNLDVDASGLLQRFCSSTSSPTEILWPLAWEKTGTSIVDMLLKISELPQGIKAAIAQVELET